MSIQEKVISLIRELGNIHPDIEITSETNLSSDLGFDSLDTVEFILALEKEFNTTYNDDEYTSLTTVKDFVDLIEKKRK